MPAASLRASSPEWAHVLVRFLRRSTCPRAVALRAALRPLAGPVSTVHGVYRGSPIDRPNTEGFRRPMPVTSVAGS